MMSLSITMITYSYTISKICNLVQKLTYILCFEHIRLKVEDSRNPNRAVKMEISTNIIPRVMLKIRIINVFMNIL